MTDWMEYIGEAGEIEHDGCRLHYRVSGSETNPPIVLTHGGALDLRSWNAQIPALIDNYRIITWDSRGHGLSKPIGGITLHGAAKDLKAVLDHLNVRNPILAGLSWGGYVIQEYAYHRMGSVRAMICLDTTAVTYTKLSKFESWSFRHSTFYHRLYPYGFLKWATPPAVAHDKSVRKYVKEAMSMMSGREFITFWKAVSRSLHFDESYDYPFPLLIAYGEEDNAGSIKGCAEPWHQHASNSTLVTIPRAKHCANQDNPERTNELILDFCSRL